MFILGQEFDRNGFPAYRFSLEPYTHRTYEGAENEARKIARRNEIPMGIFERVAQVAVEIDSHSVQTSTDLLTDDITDSIAQAVRQGRMNSPAELRRLVAAAITKALTTRDTIRQL